MSLVTLFSGKQVQLELLVDPPVCCICRGCTVWTYRGYPAELTSRPVIVMTDETEQPSTSGRGSAEPEPALVMLVIGTPGRVFSTEREFFDSTVFS